MPRFRAHPAHTNRERGLLLVFPAKRDGHVRMSGKSPLTNTLVLKVTFVREDPLTPRQILAQEARTHSELILQVTLNVKRAGEDLRAPLALAYPRTISLVSAQQVSIAQVHHRLSMVNGPLFLSMRVPSRFTKGSLCAPKVPFRPQPDYGPPSSV